MPPICVDCQLEMRPKKNGFIIELMAEAMPYQKFRADKWSCPNCSFEIVSGCALTPFAESLKPDNEAWNRALSARESETQFKHIVRSHATRPT